MATFVRLLIVEDNKFDAEVIIEHLSYFRLVKVKFERVTSLAGARKLLAVEAFDGVLLDLNLPDSTGADTVAELVRIAPNIPVLVVTSSLEEDIMDKSLKAGADMFIRKNDIQQHRLAVGIMSLLVNDQIGNTNNLESAG